MALEGLATINSFIRTLLTLLVMGVLGAGGYYGYETYYAKENAQEAFEEQKRLLLAQQVENDKLRRDVKQKEQEIVRLTTANRLLKMQHRVAQLSVIDQGEDEETGELYSEVRFVEVNDEGQPITHPKTFRLRGDVVYIDNWIVKFKDEYIEQSDPNRSTSIVLFRRIFSEDQRPADGYPLDPVGTHPQSYARGTVSEFEQEIWSDFWTIANDPKKSEDMGIRAAHGEAVSIKVQEGKQYKIELRAADGLSITPDGTTAVESDRPAA